MNPNLGSFYQLSLEPQYNLLATPAAQALMSWDLLMKWSQRLQV